MIQIKNLTVKIEDKIILNDFNLEIKDGEVHAIMGPNGTGKSTLVHVISGKEEYEVVSGEIIVNGKDILELEPFERAAEGVFVAFQSPVEIPGVGYNTFMRQSYNSIAKQRGEEEISSSDFLKKIKQISKDLGISSDLLRRGVNVGFSGGERKRAEIMQMTLLDPNFCVLDETDSGLDVDALKVVSDGVNRMRSDNRHFLIITHFSRLLEQIKPDYVHILKNGKIQKTGGPELAHEIEENGYANE